MTTMQLFPLITAVHQSQANCISPLWMLLVRGRGMLQIGSPQTNNNWPRWNSCLVSESLCAGICISAPFTALLNQSLSAGVVPQQWKAAAIMPVPETAKLAQCTDFRPISVTLVLSRITERNIFRTYDYSALQQLHRRCFSDQNADWFNNYSAVCLVL